MRREKLQARCNILGLENAAFLPTFRGKKMTLNEFIALVKDNLDLYVQDYCERREQEKNKDDAFPLENTRRRWFTDFEIWLQIKEVEESVAEKKRELSHPNKNEIEFNLNSFEDET